MSEKPTTPDLVELTGRVFDAANRGDLDAFMSFCTPSGVYDASYDGVGIFEGPAAVRGLIEDWWRAFDDLTFHTEEVRVLGPELTLTVVRHDGRPAGSPASVQTRQAYILQWVGSMIRRVTVYGDVDVGRAAAERLVEERA
jgi:ketosteroid isomerase-like protein